MEPVIEFPFELNTHFSEIVDPVDNPAIIRFVFGSVLSVSVPFEANVVCWAPLRR